MQKQHRKIIFAVILERSRAKLDEAIESTNFNAVDSIGPQPLASSWVPSRMTITFYF
jgi:hypothetical protein